jgi:hypothetical protein
MSARHPWRSLLFIAALLPLPACASYLSVQTDIYTGKAPEVALSKQQVQSAKSRLESQVRKPDADAKLKTSAEDLIRSLDSVEKLFDSTHTQVYLAEDEPFLRSLRAFGTIASRLAVEPDTKPETRAAANDAQQIVRDLTQSSLHDEHMAEILKQANEDHWQNSPANCAEVFTFLGNAEVLVRQDKRKSSDAGGEFHIKGVIFDPSQVSEAVFTTVEQSIRVLAAAYGVPTTTSSEDGVASPAGRLAFRAREWKAEGAEEEALLAMQSAYLDLLRELEKVPASGNLAAEEIDRIRGVLEAARDKLKASPGGS